MSDSAHTPHAGYIVRVSNGAGGSGAEWNATSASGDAIFYLVGGTYQYQVEMGTYNSGHLPASGFAVVANTNATYTQVVP